MSLAGNLRTMDLPEVLQWIASARKTGTLHLERRSVTKKIYFQGGGIYTSWSNDPRETLGQILVRERLITEEQLFKALLSVEQKGGMLGVLLIADGTVGEEDLRRVLQDQGRGVHLRPLPVAGGQVRVQGRRDGGRRPHPHRPRRHLRDHGGRAARGRVGAHPHRVPDPGRLLHAAPRRARGDHRSRRSGACWSWPAPASPWPPCAWSCAAASSRRRSWPSSCHGKGFITVVQPRSPGTKAESDPVGIIQTLLAEGGQRLGERRYELALQAYEQVLAMDRLNQNAKKGLVATIEARDRERTVKKVPLDKVPRLTMDMASLTRQNFDPQEGFVLSRVNGMWDVGSILKLCPMNESDVLLIFARLLERKVIELD